MKKIIIATMVIITAGLSMATIINVNGDGADRTLGLNASYVPTIGVNIAATTVNAGDDNGAFNQLYSAAILVFQLPSIPVGEAITTANLGVYWDADNMQSIGSLAGSTDTAMPKWCDLYAVRYSASSAIITNDWGYKASVGVNDVLLESQFLYQDANVTMNATLAETSVSADAALASWLTAQYAAGAVAGDYIFLRVHAMKDSGNAWKVTSGDAATQKPLLTIETSVIPEPATVGMIGLGAVIAMLVRRIKVAYRG